MKNLPGFDGLITEFAKKTGFSLQLTEVVQEACARLRLQDVSRKQYCLSSKPGVAEGLLGWFKRSMCFVVPVMLLRSGRASDEKTAQEMASQMIGKLGEVPDECITSVVGRKP